MRKTESPISRLNHLQLCSDIASDALLSVVISLPATGTVLVVLSGVFVGVITVNDKRTGALTLNTWNSYGIPQISPLTWSTSGTRSLGEIIIRQISIRRPRRTLRHIRLHILIHVEMVAVFGHLHNDDKYNPIINYLTDHLPLLQNHRPQFHKNANWLTAIEIDCFKLVNLSASSFTSKFVRNSSELYGTSGLYFCADSPVGITVFEYSPIRSPVQQLLSSCWNSLSPQ